MKLLIDANILLDVLQNREKFVEESSIIWKLCETEKVEGYVSTLTFANLVYICIIAKFFEGKVESFYNDTYAG